MRRFLLTVLSLAAFTSATIAKPLLDMVDIQGERENQLVGYGLVVGLAGSGDKNQVRFAAQSLNNMLKQFGVQMDENTLPRARNVAAVAVTATLSTTTGVGQKLDVTITSLGDAKSLHGGTLMLTPLYGVDGEVYALAQGNIVVGGINASGADGSSVTVNVPTAGLIPDGAIVEREIPQDALRPELVMHLRQPSFKTARNTVLAINEVFGPGVAEAHTQSRIVVGAPLDPNHRITFMSMLQDVDVDTGRVTPKIVFNSRTGTVVMNDEVRVKRAAVSHGNITITIAEQQGVSQPIAPFTDGTTEKVNSSAVGVSQDKSNMMLWPEGTSLQEIVNAINALGATPSELMSILIALDNADAIDGELVVI